jgi:hypothetical protein
MRFLLHLTPDPAQFKGVWCEINGKIYSVYDRSDAHWRRSALGYVMNYKKGDPKNWSWDETCSALANRPPYDDDFDYVDLPEQTPHAVYLNLMAKWQVAERELKLERELAIMTQSEPAPPSPSTT